MSSRQQLPDDQRTVLALLIDRGMTYESAAGALGTSSSAVRERAQSALAMIAPAQARDLPVDGREAIGDYMLGQQDAGRQSETREMIESSAPASAYAHALSQQLEDCGEPGQSPPASAAQTEADGAPSHATGQDSPAAAAAGAEPARRRSNLIALIAVTAVAIAAVVLAVVLNKSPGDSLVQTTSKPTIIAHAIMASPGGTKSAGLFELLKGGSKLAYYVAAVGLEPTHGFYYALWLTDGPGKPRPLNRAPSVGSNGRIVGGALLPTAALHYREVLLTRETQQGGVPSSPGETVLKGKIDFAR